MSYNPGPAREGRVQSETYQVGAKVLTREPPTFVKIKGEPGAVFRFLTHVDAEPKPRHRTRREWIEVVGGVPPAGKQGEVSMFRYFRPDRISQVVKRPAWWRKD